MNIHTKKNLHTYKQTESWTETIFTGMLMIGTLVVIALIYEVTLRGGK